MISAVRKLFGRFLPLLRLLNALSEREVALYRAIEHDLIRPTAVQDRSSRHPWLPLPPAPVVRQALAGEADYRLIDPAQMSAEDSEFVQQHGLDMALLLANSDSLQQGQGSGDDQQDSKSDPTEFQRDALIQGAIQAICPITGQLLKSDRGFIAEQNQPIFYLFRGQFPFLLAVGREGRGYIKLYLYVPAWRTALLLTDHYRWHGRHEIDQIRAHLIAEHRAIRQYLARTDPPLRCALVDNRQFAHHIWNVLSALEWLIDGGYVAHLDRLILAEEPIGEIDQIFPELQNAPIERHRFPAAINTGLNQNWFLLRPGGTRISDHLIERLHRYAESRTPMHVHRTIARLKTDHWPIVCVTLRTGNRTWVSQQEGMIAIAHLLARDYPNAALIVDGFSRLHGQSAMPPAQQEQIIHQELALVQAMRKALGGGLNIQTTIGEPIVHSMVYTQIIDCYLAHHGSLQHKIGWLSNAPGLVHANSLVLSTPQLWEPALQVRPGAPKPLYLPASMVRDSPGATRVANNRWLDDLDNYEMDAATVYGILKQIIEQLRVSRDSSANA